MQYVISFLKFLLIIVIIIQQILFSWNIMINKILLLVIDIILIIVLIYFLIRSINNIQMYIIYIYSIVTKITIIFFISFPKYIINEKLEDISSDYYDKCSQKIVIVTIAILITIVVYLLLCYIGHYNLLNIHTISTENILFFIIITHVSIDLIDISEFFFSSYFYFLLYYFRLKEEISLFKENKLFLDSSIHKNILVNFYTFTLNTNEVIFIIFGVLIALNISLHAYSLPNYSYKTTKRGNEDTNEKLKNRNNKNTISHFLSQKKKQQNERNRFDMLLLNDNSNKYNNEEYYIDQNNIYYDKKKYNNKYNFHFKKKQKSHSKIAGDAMSCLKYISIYSFIFTDISFFSARLFIYFVFSSNTSSIFFIIKNVCFIIIHGSRIFRKSKYYHSRKRKKKKKKKKKKGIVETCNHKNVSENINSFFQSHSNYYLKKSYVNTNFTKSYSSNDTIILNEINNNNYNRITNLNYRKIKGYFYLLYLRYNGINFKRYISCYVENIEKYPTRCFIIFLFFFLLIAVKITIVVIIYTFNFDDEFKKNLYEITFLYNFSVIRSCLILNISLIIISSYCISVFFIYLILCSTFDAIFMSILYFFNLLSYLFTLIIISQYTPTHDISIYFNKNKNIIMILFVFAYLVYLFLGDTYILIYMLLGRKYTTYKYRINIKKKINKGSINNENEEIPISISVISSLIVKLIKYMKGPLILNKVIIGNNFIKNTRLDNFLYFCHIKEVAFKMILYFSCFFLVFRNNNINFSFVFKIFLINLSMSILYLILSKINRNIAMDYTFTQVIFLELYKGKEFNYPLNYENKYEQYSYDHLILFDNCLNFF
ncbi:conserved Plasmodium membrane protein, unknown function [Plasmodium gallinaceum]|uniref:Uncharacterized protein n=1 Tax=Plasmodium gallinaceum TaxID=5849 RepID=A0A1J1GPM0_PLAGA|nr:LOW QUALITY PROTEIN: conserved Plasmodium membrane protein, unknown function [Plasmodium gallinaceum]CRG94373.1 conserved Plasmodium membrane protein, unknown function [Plasmodium gallinaceum]